MHDTLHYLARDPVHRKLPPQRHDLRPALRLLREFRPAALATTRWCTARARCSRKMAGDDWQKFADAARLLRLHVGLSRQEAAVHGPGIRPAATNGARRARSTGTCSTTPPHDGMQTLVRDLNRLYRATPALHARDCEAEGFEWLIADDAENSVFAWLRKARRRAARSPSSPTSRRCRATATSCRCRRPAAGARSLNTDAADYGGSGRGNLGGVVAAAPARTASRRAPRSPCRRWRR